MSCKFTVETCGNFGLVSCSQEVESPNMWFWMHIEELRSGCAPKDKKASVAWLLVPSCLEKQVYLLTLPHIQNIELFPNWSSGILYSCPSTKVIFLPFLFSCFFCLPTNYSFSPWTMYLCEVSIARWFPRATIRSPYWTGIKGAASPINNFPLSLRVRPVLSEYWLGEWGSWIKTAIIQMG